MIEQSFQLDDSQKASFWERHNEKFYQLQARRDESFVDTINRTLSFDEVGVLILGAGHIIHRRISPRIKVDIIEGGIDPDLAAQLIKNPAD